MVLLALKDKLNYFAYNTGSETVSGVQLAEIIKELVPNAEITFEPNANYTPFIDEQNDERIRKEISFTPRSLKEGIKAHMNEAREYNNLKAL